MQIEPCPLCNGAIAYGGNPARSFCDDHYAKWLARQRVRPANLDRYRAAVIAQLDDRCNDEHLSKAINRELLEASYPAGYEPDAYKAPTPHAPPTSQSDEAVITEALTERDEAQEALSQAYYLVTGRSPEWSSLFGIEQALEEIDEACRLLREAAKPKAVGQIDEALVEELARALCRCDNTDPDSKIVALPGDDRAKAWELYTDDAEAILPIVRANQSKPDLSADDAGLVAKLELWFFRECNEGTRRHLYALFDMPLDEITSNGIERKVFRSILRREASRPDLSAQLTEAKADADALEGYRAAIAYVGADSWDGCSDCIEVLKKAAAADYTRDMSPDQVAEALKAVREKGSAVELVSSKADAERLAEALDQIETTEYVHYSAGTYNFERLQSLARQVLASYREKHNG